MNKVVLQLWEDYERGKGIRPSGCSIHINSEERDKYISQIYKDRSIDNIPYEYENTLGEEIVAFVDDQLYKIVEKEKNVRLSENQFNNLVLMEELIIKD